MTPALSVVLPACLEGENLQVLLPRLVQVLRAAGETFEIVVVDGSPAPDGTEEACRAHGARRVPQQHGRGYGDAVRKGIAATTGGWVLIMDADGSSAPEFVPELLARRDAADVVVASRYVDGGGSENGLALRAMSRLLNLVYSRTLGLSCRDVSNSFKLYRGELLRALELRCAGFDVLEEIVFRLSRLHPGLRLVEAPYALKKRLFGESKRNLARLIPAYLSTLVRLRLGR